MRPIKYKAYLKEHKEIVTVDAIDFIEKEITVIDEFGNDYYFPFDEINLMQYTGLKDKNGREIYEGHIIKKDISKFTKLDPRPEVFYGEVKYYEASFWIDNAKIEHAEPLFDDIDPIQVIGNTFQNGELLNDS